MTTIAYTAGVLAADSRVTQEGRIDPGNYTKIERLPGGALFGGSGSIARLKKLRNHIVSCNKDLLPTWDEAAGTEAICVCPDGTAWSYGGEGVWLECKGAYLATGTGADYAYGAMAHGASAKEAVKIAKQFDPSSGGPVRVLRLKETE